MMKAIFFFIILITLNSCNRVNSLVLKTIDVERKIYEESNCFDIIHESTKAQKISDQLVVDLASGKTIVFKDTLVEEESLDMILYELLGDVKSTDEILIRKTYLNYSQHILVNAKTGSIIELLEQICFSDNGNLITSNYSLTDELGIHELYVMQGKTYNKIEMIQNNLILDSPKWFDRNRLVFRSLANKGKYYSIRIENLD